MISASLSAGDISALMVLWYRRWERDGPSYSMYTDVWKERAANRITNLLKHL